MRISWRSCVVVVCLISENDETCGHLLYIWTICGVCCWFELNGCLLRWFENTFNLLLLKLSQLVAMNLCNRWKYSDYCSKLVFMRRILITRFLLCIPPTTILEIFGGLTNSFAWSCIMLPLKGSVLHVLCMHCIFIGINWSQRFCYSNVDLLWREKFCWRKHLLYHIMSKKELFWISLVYYFNRCSVKNKY